MAEKIEERGKNGKKVLIVEDDDTLRKLLVIECKQRGHEVLEFLDAAEAMRIIERDKPQIDAAIIDLMNMGYGGNLGDFLRKFAQYKSTKVIFYTALSDRQFNKRILKQPNTFYIQKEPGSIKTVMDMI
jgi:DNA-binding response OmpR family regulator